MASTPGPAGKWIRGKPARYPIAAQLCGLRFALEGRERRRAAQAGCRARRPTAVTAVAATDRPFSVMIRRMRLKAPVLAILIVLSWSSALFAQQPLRQTQEDDYTRYELLGPRQRAVSNLA